MWKEIRTEEYLISEKHNLNYRIFIPYVPWKDSFDEIMKQHRCVGIRLSHPYGWKPDNFEFLSKHPDLRSLEIYIHEKYDVDILYELQNLVHFVSRFLPKKKIDVTKFKNLESLHGHYKNEIVNVEECTRLKRLHIDGWPYEDVTALHQLQDLQLLQIYHTRKLHTLHGIEALKILEELYLIYCYHLTSLTNVQACTKLKEIEIHCCKRIEDIPYLKPLKNLREFSIDNCKEIPTLTAIKDNKKLSFVSIIESTNVMDGDLSFLLELKKLETFRASPRKQYPIVINNMLHPVHMDVEEARRRYKKGLW